MTDKCFCHLNEYKVKDADARSEIENLKSTIGEGTILKVENTTEYPVNNDYTPAHKKYVDELIANFEPGGQTGCDRVFNAKIYCLDGSIGAITTNGTISMSSSLKDLLKPFLTQILVDGVTVIDKDYKQVVIIPTSNMPIVGVVTALGSSDMTIACNYYHNANCKIASKMIISYITSNNEVTNISSMSLQFGNELMSSGRVESMINNQFSDLSPEYTVNGETEINCDYLFLYKYGKFYNLTGFISIPNGATVQEGVRLITLPSGSYPQRPVHFNSYMDDGRAIVSILNSGDLALREGVSANGDIESLYINVTWICE